MAKPFSAFISKKCTLSRTRIYQIYQGMKQRCYNPSNGHYIRYGARGITICPEWLGENGLSNFILWSLKNGYEEDLTIDRIDNDKGYSPDNCQWVTQSLNASKGCHKESDFRQIHGSCGEVVRQIIRAKSMKAVDVAKHLGTTPQNLNRKFTKDSWSVQDLISVMDFLDCKMYIESKKNTNPDTKVVFTMDDITKPKK